MDFANYWYSSGVSGGGDVGDPIGSCLRFSGTQFLWNTSGGSDNGKAPMTYSFWIKFCEFVNAGTIFSFGNPVTSASADGPNLFYNLQNATNESAPGLLAVSDTGGGNNLMKVDGRYFDPSAWYHIVFRNGRPIDEESGQSTTVFINGEPRFQRNSNTGQGTNGSIAIGALATVAFNYNITFQHYLAQCYAVSDQALPPTAFGRYNDQGIWVPIKYEGTFGNKGFHLDFSSETIYDSESGSKYPWYVRDLSGNGMDFQCRYNTDAGLQDVDARPFEFEDPTSPLYDIIADSPTKNNATFNSGEYTPGTLKESNLKFTRSNKAAATTTQGAQQGDGKFYYEVICSQGNQANFGYSNDRHLTTAAVNIGADDSTFGFSIRLNSTASQFQAFGEAAIPIDFQAAKTDKLGIGVDFSTGVVVLMQNGNQIFTTTITFPNDEYYTPFVQNQSSSGNTYTINLGQQPGLTFPAGYTTSDIFNTEFLPRVSKDTGTEAFRAMTGDGADILAIAQGTNTTGTNWNPTITTGFTNALWWIKDTKNTNQWQFVDSVRGGNLALNCPTVGGETAYVEPSGNSIAFCWDASSPASNGFEIIRYSGNGTSQTINHNLGTTPGMIITQPITSPSDPALPVWHTGLGSEQNYILLNSGAKEVTGNTQMWSNVNASSYTVGSDPKVNQSGTDNMIAYVFGSVPGYSLFGSYLGNGKNSNEGAFVYTGFMPAFVMIKRLDATTDWVVYNTTSSGLNPGDTYLRPNQANKAVTGSSNAIDFFSNGFKCTGAGTNYNASNRLYMYAAFAENPFGGENVVPVTGH